MAHIFNDVEFSANQPFGSAQSYFQMHWQEPWGDRRKEIVFIGAGIDWLVLKSRLDACLVPEETATSLDALPAYLDPLPDWTARAAAE